MEGEEVGLDFDGVGIWREAWEVEVAEVGGWRHEQVDGGKIRLHLAIYISTFFLK